MNNATTLLVFTCILIAAPLTAAQNTGSDIPREDAVAAIENASRHITALREAGLPLQEANNSLQQARQTLQRADYAQRLRENATGPAAQEARQALAGLNYENFRYRDVLQYTEQVRERRETAFTLHDRIQAAWFTLQQYRENGVNTTGIPAMITAAETVFTQGQFDTAETRIQEAEETLSNRKAAETLGDAVTERSHALVMDNLVFFTVFTILLVVGGVIDYTVLRKQREKKRRETLEAEKQAVTQLLEETQKDFFVNQTIPKTVYQLRMEIYQDELHQINAELDALTGTGEGNDEDENTSSIFLQST